MSLCPSRYRLLDTRGKQIHSSSFRRHRLLGRCLGAQAAEDTETVINGDFPGVTFVGQGNGAGWTHLGSRSRVLPFVEVEARSSAKAFGDLSGLGRIVYGYYSRAGRLLKNLEHRLPVRPRVGKIETLVDHRKIRNDVSLDRFHQRW